MVNLLYCEHRYYLRTAKEQGMKDMKRAKASPITGELIQRLCDMDESFTIEFKRVSGKMVHKALETIVAFVNTEGGFCHVTHPPIIQRGLFI